NLIFSMNIIQEDWKKRGEKEQPKVAVVTNNYHVLRDLFIAKKHHIDCIGYGARSKFYFSLNAFIREFVAYIVLTRKTHEKVLITASLFILGWGLFSMFIGY